MKIHKNNNLVAILGSFAVALSLSAYAPNENMNNLPPESTENISQYDEENLGELEQVVKEKAEYLDQKIADEEVQDYLDEVYEKLNLLSSSSENLLNSEELAQTIATIENNGKELSDFIFNGGEISGYTFNDLSENGREKARETLTKLDNFIEKYVPNYKERFHEWTVGKGADAVELWEDVQEWYNEYKEEVLEEHNRRLTENASNRVIKK